VNTAFILGLLSTSRDGAFAEGTSLTFVADDKEISVGSGQLFWRRGPRALEQMIQYRISRSDLIRIASAKKLVVKVGKYSGTVGPALRETLSSLFDAIG
jgi:hypothetical protein